MTARFGATLVLAANVFMGASFLPVAAAQVAAQDGMQGKWRLIYSQDASGMNDQLESEFSTLIVAGRGCVFLSKNEKEMIVGLNNSRGTSLEMALFSPGGPGANVDIVTEQAKPVLKADAVFLRGVYEVKGDRLRLSVVVRKRIEEETAAPTDFSLKVDGSMLLVYERAK